MQNEKTIRNWISLANGDLKTAEDEKVKQFILKKIEEGGIKI